jgi:hypothetical protein
MDDVKKCIYLFLKHYNIFSVITQVHMFLFTLKLFYFYMFCRKVILINAFLVFCVNSAFIISARMTVDIRIYF